MEKPWIDEGMSFSEVGVFRWLPMACGHPDNKLSGLPERGTPLRVLNVLPYSLSPAF